MHKPVLSVIVPVYNAAQTLSRCVESILNQEFSNFELILVDDGSTDDSLKYCRQFERQDNKVQVIHKRNGGLGSARNAGLSKIKGQYVTFVDADDYVAPDSYSKNIVLLNSNLGGVDILQYPVARVKGCALTGKRGPSVPTAISGRLPLFESWLKHRDINNYFCNKIFRRKLFDTISFREDMFYEDRYLMCDILNCCRSVMLSDKGLYYYTYTEGQITSRPDSPDILRSKLLADLHIVEYIKDMPELTYEYFERYNNGLEYYRRLKTDFHEIDHHLRKILLVNIPSISRTLSSNIPMGIKFRIGRLHLLQSI